MPKKGHEMAKVKVQISQRRFVAAKLQERWGLTRSEALEQAERLLAAALESNRQEPQRKQYFPTASRRYAMSACC